MSYWSYKKARGKTGGICEASQSSFDWNIIILNPTKGRRKGWTGAKHNNDFIILRAWMELQRLDKEIQKVLKSIDRLCMCMAVYLIKLDIFRYFLWTNCDVGWKVGWSPKTLGFILRGPWICQATLIEKVAF